MAKEWTRPTRWGTKRGRRPGKPAGSTADGRVRGPKLFRGATPVTSFSFPNGGFQPTFRTLALSPCPGLLILCLLILAPVGCRMAEDASPYPGVPQRIVSTAPSITEMLFALGAGDRVVGVTSYCRFPPEARSRPKIGSFVSLDMEALLAQRPDLVLLSAGRRDLQDQLRSASLPFLVLDHDELQGIYRSIRQLARVLKIEARGDALVASIEDRIDGLRRRFGGRPIRSVLLVVGRTPGSLSDLYVVGDVGYLADLIRLAGGRSLFSGLHLRYPRVSLEEVLVRDPDVIIDMSSEMEPSQAGLRHLRDLWAPFPNLKAIRKNRIFRLSSGLFTIPGPRVAVAAERLARVVNSEGS